MYIVLGSFASSLGKSHYENARMTEPNVRRFIYSTSSAWHDQNYKWGSLYLFGRKKRTPFHSTYVCRSGLLCILRYVSALSSHTWLFSRATGLFSLHSWLFLKGGWEPYPFPQSPSAKEVVVREKKLLPTNCAIMVGMVVPPIIPTTTMPYLVYFLAWRDPP